MPPKKKKYESISVRLLDEEAALVDADIKSIAEHGGPPASRGSYCKHASLTHPRLRAIEGSLRAAAAEDPSPAVRAAAKRILEAA